MCPEKIRAYDNHRYERHNIMMFRPLMAAAIVAFSATLAMAQNDPVAQRIAVMKRVGEATKPVAEMLKGAEPFDAAKVKAALDTYQTSAKDMPALFPVDSMAGKDSTAAPKIWENKADFDAKFTAFSKASAAAAAKITDEASFKTEMKTVLGSCKGCHDDYRVKK